MKSKFYLFMAFFVITIFACQNDSKSVSNTTANTKTSESTGKTCKYTIKNESVIVNWTAFKTTKRVGVKGVFDEVEVNTASGAPSLAILLRATSFRINTKSVNSDNKDRDAKLIAFFFEKLAGDQNITGSVKSVEGDSAKGNGVMNIRMNGLAKETSFGYVVKDDVLTLSTKIELGIWGGLSAIASVNKACEEKHTGEDGVSKTWPDVDVSVVVPMAVVCE